MPHETAQHDSQDPLVGIPRVFAFALLILAVSHTVWQHVRTSGDPWSRSHTGYCGIHYEKAFQAFDDIGIGTLRGIPSVQHFPWGTRSVVPYAHHPLLPYWAHYVAWQWGGSRGMRLLSLAILLVGMLGLFFLTRRFLESGGAALATAAYACLPVTLSSGHLVDWFSPAVAALCPVTLAWLKWRESGTFGAASLYFASAMIAGLCSWSIFALVPGFWLHHLISKEKSAVGRWGFMFWTGFPFGVALLAFVGWVIFALPANDLETNLRFLTSSVSGADYYKDLVSPNPVLQMARDAMVGIGIGLLVLALAGLVLSGLPSHGPAGILLVAGCVHYGLFWSRAATHPYWVWFLGPLLAYLATRALLVVMSRFGNRSDLAVALILGVAGLLALGAWEGAQKLEEERVPPDPEEVLWFEDVMPPGSVVVLASSLRSVETYATCDVPLLLIEGPHVYRFWMEQISEHLSSIDHLWIVAAEKDLVHRPWINELPIVLKTVRHLELDDRAFYAAELDKEKVLTVLPGN